MDSVKASDMAANWGTFYARDLDREKEDDENLAFYDERESLTRRETKEARDDVRNLQARRVELQAEVKRARTLQRTETKFWSASDIEWYRSVQDTFFAGLVLLRGSFSPVPLSYECSFFKIGLTYSVLRKPAQPNQGAAALREGH